MYKSKESHLHKSVYNSTKYIPLLDARKAVIMRTRQAHFGRAIHTDDALQPQRGRIRRIRIILACSRPKFPTDQVVQPFRFGQFAALQRPVMRLERPQDAHKLRQIHHMMRFDAIGLGADSHAGDAHGCLPQQRLIGAFAGDEHQTLAGRVLAATGACVSAILNKAINIY